MEGSNSDSVRKPKPYRSDVPVRDADVDSAFKYEVADKFGGEGLLRCLKCGACSGGCPVGSVIDYRPRRVLGNVLLGLREQVLVGENLWLCAACFTCEERCVQEVNFTDVVTVLRNMASEEGHAAPGYVKMAKTVMEHGRVSKATGHVGKIREELGLPPFSEPDMEQLHKIIQSSGFLEIIEANEGRESEE
ncbi:MAG: 4Fe-4S dicluster domain-containing protein [Candidatus Thorarchaeota archaeon]|nr:MAG: 4Fe-4S dicluster domain-containing protein [Candidatus Thorarchaeota archaeon]